MGYCGSSLELKVKGSNMRIVRENKDREFFMNFHHNFKIIFLFHLIFI